MLIKICGITNPADAADAVAAGADALGFVFAPSPRRITLSQAAAIGAKLPANVLRVGVFVSPALEEVLVACQAACLDLAQIHGDFPAEAWRRLGHKTIRAVAAGYETPDQALTNGPPRYLLLDTHKRGRYGGTGEVFDWTAAPRYAALGLPLLIAGGLNPGNVRAALEATHPAGIDVSSGVERAPGLKDPDLMRTFVRAVREFSAP